MSRGLSNKRTKRSVEENLGAANVELNPEELRDLNDAQFLRLSNKNV